MLEKCRIQVEGFGLIEAYAGELFLDVLNRRGLDLHNDCGGNLKCGKCKIVFHTPAPALRPGDMRHLKEESRARGVRLACTHQIEASCRITIPQPPPVELLDNLTDEGCLDQALQAPGDAD